MKTLLIVLLSFTILSGCKKDETTTQSLVNPPVDTTKVDTPCPNSTFYLKFSGDSCNHSVLDQFVGQWEIYDSCILTTYRDGHPPTYIKIIGTFTGSVIKENSENGIVYFIVNLWGDSISKCTLHNNTDSINAYSLLLPDYKGNTVRARNESQKDIPFKLQTDGSLLFKRSMYVDLGSGFANSNYFYIRLKRK